MRIFLVSSPEPTLGGELAIFFSFFGQQYSCWCIFMSVFPEELHHFFVGADLCWLSPGLELTTSPASSLCPAFLLMCPPPSPYALLCGDTHSIFRVVSVNNRVREWRVSWGKCKAFLMVALAQVPALGIRGDQLKEGVLPENWGGFSKATSQAAFHHFLVFTLNSCLLKVKSFLESI